MTRFKQIVVLLVVFVSTAEGDFVVILCCNKFTGIIAIIALPLPLRSSLILVAVMESSTQPSSTSTAKNFEYEY